LITKTIYETLAGDFNNTIHILSQIILLNELGFYVSMTLFWALFLNFFKKDSHHYFKMYEPNKFFKLLDTLNDEEIELEQVFHLLLLISIFQNYVLLNKNITRIHLVFREFFKVTPQEFEKLKSFLVNIKTLLEINDSANINSLMVSNKPQNKSVCFLF
jgi:hypothetical protein